MILLVHMLFGAAIGYKIYSLTSSIWLAVFSAFLSHYFLDLFPHIEYLKSTEESLKNLRNSGFKKHFRDIAMVSLDFFLGLFFVFLLSKNRTIIYALAMVAAFPDALTVITWLFPNKVLLAHYYFHGVRVHFLKHKKIPKFWRIFTQAIVILISIVILRF